MLSKLVQENVGDGLKLDSCSVTVKI